jgi:outer membrane protein TolC
VRENHELEIPETREKGLRIFGNTPLVKSGNQLIGVHTLFPETIVRLPIFAAGIALLLSTLPHSRAEELNNPATSEEVPASHDYGFPSETLTEERQSPPKDTLTPLPTIELGHVFTVVSGGLGRELPLSIGDMVRMALSNNPEIKIQRIEPELGEADIRRAWGRFDPTFSFQTSYSESDTPQNAQDYIATGGQTTQSQLALLDQLIILQEDLNALIEEIGGTAPSGGNSANIPDFKDPRNFSSQEFGMNWQLGGTTPLGTQYAFTLNQLQARNDLNSQLPPSLFYPEITTFAGITLTQPLLKDFGPAANMAGVRISRIQKRIGWYEWKKQLIRSLSEALYRYFDLAFAHENLKVRTEAVQAAQLLEKQNIRRVEEGRMRPSDVWEAQTSLSFNLDLALRAMNTFIESQNALKAVIFTESMARSGEIGRIAPTTALDVPAIAIDRSRFIGDALANRPEYLQIVSRDEQEALRVRFARNQALPTVNLQGSVGYTGLEGDYGNSLSQAFGAQGTAYSVGVVVSIPLGNVEGRANLDAAKLRKRQTDIAIEKAVTEIAIEVDTAISLLETSRLQVGTARDTAIAAGKTARAEEKLLEEGKSTTFEVVRLQNNASDARSRHLAAIATYRKNAVRLAVARGKLLEELGVNVEAEALKTSLPGNRRKPDLPQSPPASD